MFSAITDEFTDNIYKGDISREDAITLIEVNPFELFLTGREPILRNSIYEAV